MKSKAIIQVVWIVFFTVLGLANILNAEDMNAAVGAMACGAGLVFNLAMLARESA